MTIAFCAVPAPSDLALIHMPVVAMPDVAHPLPFVEQLIETAYAQQINARSAKSRGLGYGGDGVRIAIPESEGVGYWEVFKVSEHAFLSITDAVFTQDKPLNVPIHNGLKIRLLMRGAIAQDSTGLDLQGPDGVAYCARHSEVNRYVIKGGERTTLILLHCKASFVTETLGPNCASLPEPFNVLSGRSQTLSGGARFALTPAMLRASYDILESRFLVAPQFRRTYLHAKCLEIWTAVLQQLAVEHGAAERTNLRRRDIEHVDRARELLQHELANPPSVQALARSLGVSATKLKTIFKVATAETMQSFLRRKRMEHAAMLLLQNGVSVGEAAAEVGYEHQANFTHAFKRHFGYCPRQVWRNNAS